MDLAEIKDLHEEHGALRLLSSIQRATTAAFNKHGSLPLSAFFLAQREPDGRWFGDQPQVKALQPHNPLVLMDPGVFVEAVSRISRELMALGVLQAFESTMTEEVFGPTGNDDLDELFGEDFEKVTEGEPHEETKDVLVLSFEHLAFRPMVRLWAAPIQQKDGKRLLGQWAEVTGKNVSSSPLTSYLTFYN